MLPLCLVLGNLKVKSQLASTHMYLGMPWLHTLVQYKVGNACVMSKEWVEQFQFLAHHIIVSMFIAVRNESLVKFVAACCLLIDTCLVTPKLSLLYS